MEPSIDVPITNVVQPIPVLKKSRKDWDLIITLYTTYGEETLRIAVDDRRGVLDIQGLLVFECTERTDAVIEETKILAENWTQFSKGSKDPDHQLPGLAAGGYRLFSKLFGSPEAEPLATGLLQRIKDRRKSRDSSSNASLRPSLSIQILTPSLYLPWELLYPSFDYAECGEHGFFGFSFCLEQQPLDPAATRIPNKAKWGVVQPTEISLQLDRRLQPDAHAPISTLLGAFHMGEIKSRERETIAKLKLDLSTEVPDEIVYFCCHGYLKPAVHIKLTCGNTLRPEDFRHFAKRHCFANRPIVFLNTCNGAVMDSAFRKSFIDAFTHLGAVAVIAPQAEVRTAFALRFASDFFEGLFNGMTELMSLGDVAYRVRVAAWAEGEPSGLLYSIYSLVLVFFQRKLNRRIDSQSVTSEPSKEFLTGR